MPAGAGSTLDRKVTQFTGPGPGPPLWAHLPSYSRLPPPCGPPLPLVPMEVVLGARVGPRGGLSAGWPPAPIPPGASILPWLPPHSAAGSSSGAAPACSRSPHWSHQPCLWATPARQPWGPSWGGQHREALLIHLPEGAVTLGMALLPPGRWSQRTAVPAEGYFQSLRHLTPTLAKPCLISCPSLCSVPTRPSGLGLCLDNDAPSHLGCGGSFEDAQEAAVLPTTVRAGPDPWLDSRSPRAGWSVSPQPLDQPCGARALAVLHTWPSRCPAAPACSGSPVAHLPSYGHLPGPAGASFPVPQPQPPGTPVSDLMPLVH